jgi:hypothetical protein
VNGYSYLKGRGLSILKSDFYCRKVFQVSISVLLSVLILFAPVRCLSFNCCSLCFVWLVMGWGVLPLISVCGGAWACVLLVGGSCSAFCLRGWLGCLIHYFNPVLILFYFVNRLYILFSFVWCNSLIYFGVIAFLYLFYCNYFSLILNDLSVTVGILVKYIWNCGFVAFIFALADLNNKPFQHLPHMKTVLDPHH